MQNRYDFIVSLVREAGEKVLLARNTHLEVSSKNDDRRDLVTNVDLEVNEFIALKIKQTYPEEFIYSEETEEEGKNDFWSIDPIDGTSNFARGIPHFAVVISYFENDIPIVGAIYNPVTQDLFSFSQERGCFLNDKPIHVNNTHLLKDAYVLLHIGRKEEVREWGVSLEREFLGKAKKITNLGSSALDLAYLAAGRVDVVVYGTMTTLDVAVATALVRAAGGEVYDIHGQPILFTKTPQQIIGTSTPELFEEIKTL